MVKGQQSNMTHKSHVKFKPSLKKDAGSTRTNIYGQWTKVGYPPNFEAKWVLENHAN